MENCKGCKWLDPSRPPMALGYCTNPNVMLKPKDRARYEPMPRCQMYNNKNEVVGNGR